MVEVRFQVTPNFPFGIISICFPLPSSGRNARRCRRADFQRYPMSKEFASMSKFVKLSFVLSFIFGLSAIAFGQSTTTGAIGGVVTNPNKEVVPNASITVRNTETNKDEVAVTDDQGGYRVTNFQPGIYMVTVSAPGFTNFVADRVTVEVGQVTTLPVTMNIGPVSG